jgi:hypothetical protein
MNNTLAYTFFAATGLLVGLVIAEIAWRKSMHHVNHVVPAAITKNANKIVWQKFFYYGVLLTLFGVEHFLGLRVPEPVYYIDVFAIAGGDIQKLANKFFRLSKGA